MKYYVIELQDGAVLAQSFNREQYENGQAVSYFLNASSIAAISQVHRHTVMFVDDMGNHVLPPYSFKHDPPQSTTQTTT